MNTRIVGIGSSAGGLEALTELLEAMPHDTGLAFVIVQHMSRTGPSMMVDLLAKHTAMPVKPIKSGEIPAPNTVYVIVPGYYVTMYEGVLALTPMADDQQLRTPIDLFFKSLADDQESDAYALVLSGTGSDGTIGVSAVKGGGGVTIAQRTDSAKFSGMPDSAAAIGLIDFLLRPSEIPAKLIELERFRNQAVGNQNNELIAEIEEKLPQILQVLKKSDSSNFSKYKPGTLVRRTMRRMLLNHISDVDTYLDELRSSESEQVALVRDFLIGVTQFFRNPEMFDYIEQHVLPEFLKRDQEEFRVWCPGCSTGEEVYSLAILVRELQSKTGDQRPWKIFGTDIDLDALADARRGTYDQASVDKLTTARRTAFFQDDLGSFTVSNSIRKMCVFAPHNVLSDPPFSRIDLICCRNLMIYINQDAQEEIISRFHYALNPRGILWLGPSENRFGNVRLFETISRTARVFRREDTITSLTPAYLNLHDPPILQLPQKTTPDIGLVRRNRTSSDVEFETEQAFLSNFSPPFVRISQHDEVIYASENIRQFLRPAKGVPSAVLDDYFIEGVRMPLRMILKAVRESKSVSEISDIVVEVNGESEVFDLLARPMDEEVKSILIAFQPVRMRDKPPEFFSSRSDTEQAYESELGTARKMLAARERDFEMAEQELRADKEELLTMNEELQSSNEELETSREELQAVNEELETINTELIANNKELGVANSNLQNLLESTDIATLFIDSDGLLKLFTPLSKDLFAIQDRDLGRSIFDLRTILDYPDLREDLDRLASSLKPFSREVMGDDGRRHFIVRLKAYRDIYDKIVGSVVSFIEITEQRLQQIQLAETGRQLERRLAELEAFYERSPIGVGLHGADMRFVRVNSALAETFGHPVNKIIGRHPADVVPEIWEIVEPIFSRIMETGEAVLDVEVTAPARARDSQIRTWIANYFPVITDDGTIIGIGVTALEVTELKQLEQAVKQKKSDLENAGERILGNFELAPIGITIHRGPDHVIVHANESARAFLGSKDPTGKMPSAFFPDHYDALKPLYDAVYRTGRTQVEDEAFVDTINASGDKVEGVFRRIIQPYRDATGKTDGVISMTLDISQLVAMRDANAKQSVRLGNIIDALDSQIALVDSTSAVLTVNKEFSRIAGRSSFEIRHHDVFEILADEMSTESLARLRDAVEMAVKGKEHEYEDQIRVSDEDELRRVIVYVKPIITNQLNLSMVREIVIAITDQTPLLEANQRKDILVAELEHRVKNVIATIQAVTQFTAASALDIDSMVEDLNERLSAMARTHAKLTTSGWSSQSFQELLDLELDAYADSQRERVFLEGDKLTLSASSSMLIGLAIHELLTNAVKYGSLSNIDGKVLITVKAKDGVLSSLKWREVGGPELEESRRQGFGTLLLMSILPSELESSVAMEFQNDGMTYELFRPS